MGMLTDLVILGGIGFAIYEYEKKLQGNQAPIPAPVTVTPAPSVTAQVTAPASSNTTLTTEQLAAQQALLNAKVLAGYLINPTEFQQNTLIYTIGNILGGVTGLTYDQAVNAMVALYPGTTYSEIANAWPQNVFNAVHERWSGDIGFRTQPTSVKFNADGTKTWTYTSFPPTKNGPNAPSNSVLTNVSQYETNITQ